jgi:hypothetical protein
VKAELGWLESPSARMANVVAVDFGVALKANRNRVVDVVAAALVNRLHVVGFHLHAAESMTDTATSVTTR